MSRTALFIDWNNPPPLQDEEFVVEMTYDALNRPVTITQPDGTVVTNGYDKGGLLKQVASTGLATVQNITNITYNAKGQRENIYYGNNTKTRYDYNPLNFRLERLLTTRNNGQDVLQDLNYDYDAVGNIVRQTDNAQQTHYFNNQVIEPTCNYTYDALYRLLTATGREQIGLQIPTHEDFPNNIPCPNSADNAMQNYTHHYQYDKLGNILQMQSVGIWTRNYEYNNPMNNNYLLGHGNGTVYSYDAHGNMLTLPHLSNMSWDYLDQLHSATNGTFTSYYNYDAEGNRTRKVVVKNNIREERYYVNGYEIYRKYVNGTLDIEHKTVNISDDEKVFVRVETKDNESPLIRYQYDNHLGSACLELDTTGQIISYEEYHPFGTTSYRSGRSETEVSLKRYKYCGKERDEETGLYYYGMRYYAAWLCRFVSVDPLQFQYPYYTPYQYAGNKPISFIDLDGGEEKKTEDREHNDKSPTINNDTQDQTNNLLPIEIFQILKEALIELKEMDTKDNTREYGGLIGYDAQGQLRIVWAKPSKSVSPKEKNGVGIDVFEPLNEEERNILVEIIGTFHSHPSKIITEPIDADTDINVDISVFIHAEEKTKSYFFDQNPSKRDIENARNRTNVKGYSFVFAMRSEEIYRYDKNTNVEDYQNPGSISFSNLLRYEKLYDNQKSQWKLMFLRNATN